MKKLSLHLAPAAHPLAALSLALSLPCTSLAQDAAASLPPTVVTATRMEQPLTDVVADVSVIDREAIARSGASAVADVLARVPGLAFLRNGGPGTNTDLYIRGAENRHTALFIDGIRVDSQSSGGGSWSAIPLAQVERIEIVRGPAAAVYGSDAIGGVVQIFTRRGEAAFTPSVTFTAGSYGTGRVDASASGANGALDYAVGVSRETSRGYNSQPARYADDDGYRSTSASASLGWKLSGDHRIELVTLYSDMDAQYDTSSGKLDEHTVRALRTAGLSWSGRWSDTHTSRVSVGRAIDRYQTRPSNAYRTDTYTDTFLVHNEWRRGPHRLSADIERREDELFNTSTSPLTTRRAQDGLALGYGFVQGRQTWQLNARRDNDSEFGSRLTGNIAAAYALTPQWKATASTGTAFRAPTLYQRFSIYGIPTLRPEHSRNREVGVKYAQAGASFSVVAYDNRVSDQISSVSGSGPCSNGSQCYANTQRTRLTGYTFAVSKRLGATELSGSLDLQEPKDLTTGKILQRRAEEILRLQATTRLARWQVGAEGLFVGRRFNNAANTVRLAGYGLLNLHATTPLSPEWTMRVRLDNAGNKAYETSQGYAMPRRALQVALQWQPR